MHHIVPLQEVSRKEMMLEILREDLVRLKEKILGPFGWDEEHAQREWIGMLTSVLGIGNFIARSVVEYADGTRRIRTRRCCPLCHSSAPIFPQEVFERIIDFVPFNRRHGEDGMKWRRRNLDDLRACALTCRAWVQRSHARLFRHVILETPAQISAFSLMVRTHPRIAGYVRYLQHNAVDQYGSGVNATPFLGLHLKNVHTLVLTPKPAEQPQYIFHANFFRALPFFSALTELYYGIKGRESLKNLARFIVAFPTLRRLHVLHGGYARTQESVLASPHLGRPHARNRLALSYFYYYSTNGRDDFEIFPLLLVLSAITSIAEMELSLIGAHDTQAIKRAGSFLHACTNLKHLTLSLHPRSAALITTQSYLNLRNNVQLQSLEFILDTQTFNWSTDAFGIVSVLLSDLSVGALRRLTLVFLPKLAIGVRQDIQATCKQVDSILLDPKFANLEYFCSDIPPENFPNLPSKMAITPAPAHWDRFISINFERREFFHYDEW